MSVESRLLAHAEPEPNTGCWLWTGYAGRWGYGSIKVAGKTVPAHRAAYMTWVGQPNGCVCHRCDQPLCINPAHLFLGTNYDNVQDRHRKGRSRGGSRPGELNAGHILTSQDVADIRDIYAMRLLSQQKLAEAFGVTQSHVSDIVRWEKRKEG